MARTQDIEDVVSAIRRLVATEAPAGRTVAEAPTLLLSQAQRVNGPDDPFQTIRPEGQAPAEADATRQAGSGAAKTETMPDGRAESAVDPFDGADVWTGATEAIDIPLNYAEDADFEEAESRAAEAAPDPEPVEEALPARTPADTGKANVPLILTASSRDLVDDDQLRDIIADVVRQELSVDLGERITRNVRKLVRREIRQMLASDDLD